MRIVVIEDEKPAARLLIREIHKLGFNVEHTLYSVAQAIPWFVQNPSPDLIFADIQLADGLSLEIFQQVKINSSIIFVTSFDHYAIKAFKLNSIDYLLKPVNPSDLLHAITKYQSQSFALHERGRILDQSIQGISYAKRLMVKVGLQIKMILLDQVVCFYKEDRGVYVCTLDGKRQLLEEESLDAVIKEVDPSRYFRVNRSQVVCIDYIEQIVQVSSSRLKISVKGYGQEVVVSRDRIGNFKNWLLKN